MITITNTTDVDPTLDWTSISVYFEDKISGDYLLSETTEEIARVRSDRRYIEYQLCVSCRDYNVISRADIRVGANVYCAECHENMEEV